MKMIFKAFAKKLFGAKYERLVRTLFVYSIVFLGLYQSGFRIQIAPLVLYLMTSSFTAGVMWQALSSKDNAANMQNMLMLPFEGRKFVLSYVAALGAYTFLTKTAALFSVALALSVWNLAELAGSILCAINAVLMAACIFSLRKYWYIGSFWVALFLAVMLLAGGRPWFLPVILGNSVFAFLLLLNLDGYSFYLHEETESTATYNHKYYSIWRYLFRYLKAHPNYLMNTVIMWCVACVMPLFLGQVEGMFAVPIGFAILSLNTPLCILLSCDPALEQAVRFLPHGERMFCVPYCFFLFISNLIADSIFLCSLQVQTGGVTVFLMAAAVFFALQSAICSVLLEWFYPLRGWKIESDLWHHPRKYIVPVMMLLLAAAVGSQPWIMAVLTVLAAAESVVLTVRCERGQGKGRCGIPSHSKQKFPPSCH